MRPLQYGIINGALATRSAWFRAINHARRVINLTKPALLTIMSAFFVLSMAGAVFAADRDRDGMSDEYESFFGLDTKKNDARLDHDRDGLSNLEESHKLTDPFQSDTDRDGFNDKDDENPISRGYIKWGDPKFTHGDVYSYAAPAWLLNVYKINGEWRTNAPPAGGCEWHVPATESNDVVSLNVDVDRVSLATNNLRYKLTFFDHVNASMFMDLIDTNEIVLATNLFGNLNSGSNKTMTITLNIPLAVYTNAAVIHLRRGSGESTVYESLLYIDEDGDGLDNESDPDDYNADTDGDGLSDYAEVFVYRTDPMKADTDKDGMPDGWEVKHGLNPLKNDAHGDKDKDGVDNLTEYKQGRDPNTGATNDTTSVVNLKVYTKLE